MAEEQKTSEKPARRPGKNGNVLPPTPKPFSAQVQPTPEQKSKGWKEKRAERLLTQAILELMTDGQNMDVYVKGLLKNALKGNPKAIETINKGVEDDVIKVDVSANMQITWHEEKTYEAKS